MDKESTFSDRLRQVMSERGYSYDALGGLLDMNPQTLNRYVLGQREPKMGTATQIAFRLGVDPMWLQGYAVPGQSAASPAPASKGANEYPIPILRGIRADAPVLAPEHIQGYTIADVPEPEKHFYLQVCDDSMMNADIHHGDLLLIRGQDTAENGQIVVCTIGQGDAILTRFCRQENFVILQPEHSAYVPKLLPASDFRNGHSRILGVAVRLVRNLS